METNLTRAEEYYKLIGEKNREEIEKYLHADVEFCAPVATLMGKEDVLQAIGNFMHVIKSLRIRAKFSSGDQAMIVYDVDIPGVVKNFPSASLLTFHNGLIIKIELFYDGIPFLHV